jgi:hypothetical protein
VHLSTEARVGIGALIAVQLVTAFGAIDLLAQTAPAVDDILTDNVASTEAVEDMLGALANPLDPLEFRAAFERAEANITEPGERPLLDRIASATPGMDTDPVARNEVVVALHELADLNRRSMQVTAEDARGHAARGAWAVSLLGLVSFAVGVMVFRRIDARLVAPIVEVDAALVAARAGDHHRRCVHLDGPLEVGRISDNLNWVLDCGVSSEPPPASTDGRATLLALLDRLPHPALVAGPGGVVVATNNAFYHAVPEPEHPPAVLADRVARGEAPPGWRVTLTRDEEWLVERGD